MKWIIDFLTTLGGIIVTLVELIITLIGSLFDFISNLPTFLSLISASFSAIPSFILPFAAISLTISIIFIILGRGKSN